jgi:hypothetical protein
VGAEVGSTLDVVVRGCSSGSKDRGFSMHRGERCRSLLPAPYRAGGEYPSSHYDDAKA